MNLRSAHKRVLRLAGFGLCALLSFFTVAWADELHLKDGRVIEVEEFYESNGVIWYRKGKVTASVAKNDVVRITRQIPTEAVKANKDALSSAKATPLAEANSAAKKN